MINHKAIGEYRYLNDQGGGSDGADGSVREAGVMWDDATEVRVIRSGSDIDYWDYKTDVITDCTVVDDEGGWRDGERVVLGKCGTMVAMMSLAIIGLTLLIIIVKIYNAGEK